MMKNLLLTTGVFVVFLLAGTDLWPCCTHAKIMFNHDGDTTLLNMSENVELSIRQKRQPSFTGLNGRMSRIGHLPTMPFNQTYLHQSQMIFHALQILYGPLWQLLGSFPNNNRDDSFDLSKVLNYFKNFRNNFNVNSLNQNLKTNFPKFQDFHQMYHMRNEISHQSYSVACFDHDRTALITVAKYLDGVNSRTSGGSGGSWQRGSLRPTASPSISNRQTLELAVTLALGSTGSFSRSNIRSTVSSSQCYSAPSATGGTTPLIG